MLTANDAVASSSPWCLRSNIDPVARLPDAERTDGKADDKEARDKRQERMVALQKDDYDDALNVRQSRILTSLLGMSVKL
jgi:hypothetical protein